MLQNTTVTNAAVCCQKLAAHLSQLLSYHYLSPTYFPVPNVINGFGCNLGIVYLTDGQTDECQTGTQAVEHVIKRFGCNLYRLLKFWGHPSVGRNLAYFLSKFFNIIVYIDSCHKL